MKVQRLYILIPAVAIAFSLWKSRAEEWNAMRWAGALIMVPACILFMIAHLQLGSSFAVTARAKNLVTTGLYSRIRNPIYFFGELLIAGAFLFIEKPLFLLLFLVLVPVQFMRVRQEEKVLEAKFGDTYRQYKQSTWF